MCHALVDFECAILFILHPSFLTLVLYLRKTEYLKEVKSQNRKERTGTWTPNWYNSTAPVLSIRSTSPTQTLEPTASSFVGLPRAGLQGSTAQGKGPFLGLTLASACESWVPPALPSVHSGRVPRVPHTAPRTHTHMLWATHQKCHRPCPH